MNKCGVEHNDSLGLEGGIRYMEEDILQLVMTRQEEDAEELRRDVLERAFRYVDYRFHWELYTREEKVDRDKYRTSAHNAFMDAVNIYVRYLNRVNGTQYQMPGEDCKKFGDLACRIVCEIAIRNR